MNDPETIFLVDDDLLVRKAVSRLLGYSGFNVVAFASPKEFLEGGEIETGSCLVLDMAMPELTGLEIQKALAARGSDLPIVFLTGRADIPMTVQAMKEGALDFLTKPVHDSELIAAVRAAVEKGRIARQARSKRDEIQTRLASLTPREREVLEHVVSGQLNKQIADDLGTCEQTIKVHRGRVMKKMRVPSVAELTRLMERARVS